MRQKGLNLVLQRTEMYLIYLKLPIYSFVMPYQNSMNLNSHIFRNAESDFFYVFFSALRCFTTQAIVCVLGQEQDILSFQ